MPDFSDHKTVLELIAESQKAEHDNREKVREAHLFLDKRDGQWEPYWWRANSGKPRYTFDLTNPIIDQISGEMEKADFDIKVKPASGEASKDVARVYDGLIRNIENISNASHVYNQAGRMMVAGGLDGWRIVQKFVDDNSFDQDLVIEKISNFVDRVWFDVGSEQQDRSDAKWGVVLQGIVPAEYRERWPNGSGNSMNENRINNAYFHQPDLIMVGEFYYIKQVEREIVLMSNGKVYEADDDFEQVKDDLKRLGITELKRRKRKDNQVFVRKLDNGGWLEEEQRTVFSFIPLIPTYGNFKIFENKLIYWGATEKFFDWQRVFNYAKSREIEEGALAPRAKYWGTEEQRAGHEDEIDTLNTNSDAWQDYNHVAGVPAPYMQGGAQINQGLVATSQSMQTGIAQSAGLFAPSMGEQVNSQSGVALEKLQNKGDISTVKYFSAQEVAICHTARILVDAIPKVYENERQVRILNEDGSFDMTMLNEPQRDRETGEDVVLNDLRAGKYDVTCSAGPSFQNKQQETVAAIVEMAGVDPSIIGVGSDVLLSNVTAPGMDLIAERKRQQLFEQGVIPVDQMTDEEKEVLQQRIAQQQEQGQAPDPATIIAQAEAEKAQAQTNKVLVEAQAKAAEIEIKEREQNRKDFETSQKADELDFNQLLAFQQQQMNQQQAMIEAINTQADTLDKLRSAMGVDTIVGPSNKEAYIDQADLVTETQEAAASGLDNDLSPEQ